MSIIVFLLLSLTQAFEVPTDKAPDFDFVLEDGSTMQLSDYNGKVVYLSFWASWCTPCISNFKKYQETRSQLEDMGIILLNISIDKTKANWTTALDKNVTRNGINGYATDIDLVQTKYKLSSIPAYEIINKSGKLVYLSDGANRNIITNFKDWLDE